MTEIVARPTQNIMCSFNGLLRHFYKITIHIENFKNISFSAVGNGWQGGWGSNGNGQGNGGGGGSPQTPVQIQPAPAPAVPQVPQVPGWGGGTGGGGNIGFPGWGGGGSGENNNNHNWFGGLFGGFKSNCQILFCFRKKISDRQKRANPSVVIGKRFTINCMQRGDSEDDMLALCGKV